MTRLAEWYSRILFTIITAALLIIAIRGIPLRLEGGAAGLSRDMTIQLRFADTLNVRFDNPLAVGFNNPLKIANPDLSPVFFVEVSR